MSGPVGEWQIEWDAVPRVACFAAAALRHADSILRGLEVDTSAMRRNLGEDGAETMAEFYMMPLAPLAAELGRERAHDLVYSAVRRARSDGGIAVGSLDSPLTGGRENLDKELL